MLIMSLFQLILSQEAILQLHNWKNVCFSFTKAIFFSKNNFGWSYNS